MVSPSRVWSSPHLRVNERVNRNTYPRIRALGFHVSICILAIFNLGKDNSLSEAAAEARACDQFYEHLRDSLMQAHLRPLAAKTQSLAEVTITSRRRLEACLSKA